MARKAKELTLYSRRILDYLRAHQSEIPPTRAEIADALSIPASSVQNSLLQLKEFGYVNLKPRVSRGITLTETGRS